jgi:hypothetical protein
MSVLESPHSRCDFSNTVRHSLFLVRSFKNAVCVFPIEILWHAFCVWILLWQSKCCCWGIQRRFPDRRIPSRDVFSLIRQTVCETGCLPRVAVQSEREVVPMINRRETFLRWFREVLVTEWYVWISIGHSETACWGLASFRRVAATTPSSRQFVIRSTPISNAGGQCETKQCLSWSRKSL